MYDLSQAINIMYDVRIQDNEEYSGYIQDIKITGGGPTNEINNQYYDPESPPTIRIETKNDTFVTELYPAYRNDMIHNIREILSNAGFSEVNVHDQKLQTNDIVDTVSQTLASANVIMPEEMDSPALNVAQLPTADKGLSV